MNACIRWFVAVLVSTLCVSPVPTAAQTQTNPSSGPRITAEQARDAFTTAGFTADPIIDWAWRTRSTSAFLRTFDVYELRQQLERACSVSRTSLLLASAGYARWRWTRLSCATPCCA